MRGASVYFDLGRKVRLGESLFEDRLVIGRPLVVIFRDGNEELRFGLRGLKVRTVWRIGHEPSAMERGYGSDAIGYGGCGAKRNGTAHAIALRADLPVFGNRFLRVQPA